VPRNGRLHQTHLRIGSTAAGQIRRPVEMTLASSISTSNELLCTIVTLLFVLLADLLTVLGHFTS
jgi:hypothetical protein